jgi:hypothetical protein
MYRPVAPVYTRFLDWSISASQSVSRNIEFEITRVNCIDIYLLHIRIKSIHLIGWTFSMWPSLFRDTDWDADIDQSPTAQGSWYEPVEMILPEQEVREISVSRSVPRHKGSLSILIFPSISIRWDHGKNSSQP